MSVRDIRGHLDELYGLEVSPDLISRVTDAVLDEVKEWRSRALDAVYPVVIFDAPRVKIRDKDSRIVKNKAVYLALGITGDGEREVLGLWIAENEGAKFWLSVMTELRNRGVQDILIAVVDGLKGFPDAINSAFPETTVQTRIVHLVRHSLNFCSRKDRKAVAAKLGTVRNFVCGRMDEHHPAMARVKRSPKMTATWALAIASSRGGIFHSFSERFKTRNRNRSFKAASSVGKCPRALTARRSLEFSAALLHGRRSARTAPFPACFRRS